MFSLYLAIFCLELAKNDDDNIRIEGNVEELPGGIPLNYKAENAGDFTPGAIKKQIDEMHDARINNDRGRYSIILIAFAGRNSPMLQ